jgi:hypothetical protein
VRTDLDAPYLHEAAKRMARECRHIVQSCLREEEWLDADAEFFAVILKELNKFVAEVGESPCSRG